MEFLIVAVTRALGVARKKGERVRLEERVRVGDMVRVELGETVRMEEADKRVLGDFVVETLGKGLRDMVEFFEVFGEAVAFAVEVDKKIGDEIGEGVDVGESALGGEGVALAVSEEDLEVLTEKLEVRDITGVRELEGVGEVRGEMVPLNTLDVGKAGVKVLTVEGESSGKREAVAFAEPVGLTEGVNN